MNLSVVIACKEIMDHMRDVRGVISSVLFVLMGPLIVGIVSIAHRADSKGGSPDGLLIGMMAVFTLVAAFIGGMNVAMDAVAGERERRSLLPLLLNPISGRDVVIGKWICVSFFGATGLMINLIGFILIFAILRLSSLTPWPRLSIIITCDLFFLPLCAAALQLFASTVSRTLKEAQTYLSLILFVPMGLGMFLVFFPSVASGWLCCLPIAGQLLQLELVMSGRNVPYFQSIFLACTTLALTVIILFATANKMECDEVFYGS